MGLMIRSMLGALALALLGLVGLDAWIRAGDKALGFPEGLEL